MGTKPSPVLETSTTANYLDGRRKRARKKAKPRKQKNKPCKRRRARDET